MKKKILKGRNPIKGFTPLHLFAISLFVLGLLGSASMTLAEDEVDLTGEVCLSGTVVIDPDGEGPLPAHTYCVMQGVLPENIRPCRFSGGKGQEQEPGSPGRYLKGR